MDRIEKEEARRVSRPEQQSAKSPAQLDREITEILRDTNQQSATPLNRESAEALWIAARDAARDNPTPANREAAKAAWAALDAASPRLRRMGTFASRAGQRQAAERRALTAKRSR